ncbi:hypothetical protein V1508DRAFT_400377 [Lipomyces doorenjongii]|uniref:uncharacterized protein n=1 Tax=Lipomyces doorenjongii TaxID=383834 RepID=UPI0034CF21C3
MKQAIIQTGLSVQIVDSPVRTPNADQVLIKVAVSDSNPKGLTTSPAWCMQSARTCTEFSTPRSTCPAPPPSTSVAASTGRHDIRGGPVQTSGPPGAVIPTGKQPKLVYGAASAVGAFALQFAKLSGLHLIIGAGGRGILFAESLIDKSKGDAIIDYRNGDEQSSRP